MIVWRALGIRWPWPRAWWRTRRAWDSLNRSVKLSKGTRGRIFVMALLVWALSIASFDDLPTSRSLMVVATVTAIGHGAEYATVTAIVAEILNVLINFACRP